MTADLRQAPGLLGALPVDPLAQAWEQILASVLAEGPPEDLEASPEPSEGLPEPSGGRPEDPGQVAEWLHVLRVAGAPEPAEDLDGPAVAAALAAIDLSSAVVADADVVAAAVAASRLAAWAAGRFKRRPEHETPPF